jgi:ribosomal protein S18 acetylase RimI-like enzyme
MKIDIASDQDVNSIVSLVNSAYRGGGSRAGWTDETRILSGPRIRAPDVKSLIEEPSTTVLLGRMHNALGGCICVEIDQSICTISMLAIDPALQSSGCGRTLLEAAERYAVSTGAMIAKMTVIQQRATLLAWYARRGYEPTGDIERFPYGDESVGIPLRDDLQFVVLQKTITVTANRSE